MASTTESAESSAERVEGPVGVVDAVFDEDLRVSVAAADATVSVRGWALDTGARPFAAIECAIGGGAGSRAAVELRPDVAAAFGSPDGVGFRGDVALGAAGIGRARVTLTGIRGDGTRVDIPVTMPFDVIPALHRLPDAPAGAAIGAVDEIEAEAEGHRGAAPDGTAQIPAGSVVVVRGWAATPEREPLDQAYAQIDGTRVVRGMTGYPRADVAANLGTDRLEYGFRIRIATGGLALGAHELRVFAHAGGVLAAIGEPRRFAVVAEREVSRGGRNERRNGGVDLVGRVDRGARVVDQRARLQLRSAERLVLTGWAGDPERGALPDLVLLTVDDAVHSAVRRGLERDDVVAKTGSAGMARSGFSTVIHGDRLALGGHRAELIAAYGDDVVVFDAFSFEVTG